MTSSLSSPVINNHNYDWKCLRFWYFIGTNDGRDLHTTSLKLLLMTLTSNQAILLFFADEVTDKARYTQIPLSRNSTNSKVLGNLLLITLQVNYDCFLLLFPRDSFSCPILALVAVKLFSIVY